MLPIHTPWKHQKTTAFLIFFQGVSKREHWAVMYLIWEDLGLEFFVVRSCHPGVFLTEAYLEQNPVEYLRGKFFAKIVKCCSFLHKNRETTLVSQSECRCFYVPVISTSYRTVPSGIRHIFSEFFVFCSLFYVSLSEIWESREIFVILHKAAVRWLVHRLFQNVLSLVQWVWHQLT